jgi:tryptophanyl-tRNA synthetase
MMARVLSGIQPSGKLTLGNYFGALSRFVKIQETDECIFCIVDLHAITVPQNPEALRRQTIEACAMYLACGIDPDKAIVFVQSHVPAHTELAWMLQCVARMGELSRMTQFKDKSGGGANAESVSVGLFTYPALMAADILLYQAERVPVGIDQKQHIELTRDLAERFNRDFGETFTIPEPWIEELGAKIMALDDPTKKMSKSSPNPASYISLLDTPEEIRKKFARATTDSEREIRYDRQAKPGISNLLEILSLCTGESISSLENRFQGKGYGDLKREVADAVVDMLTPIQERFHRLIESGEAVEVFREGAKKANESAQATLQKVRERMGFLPF